MDAVEGETGSRRNVAVNYDEVFDAATEGVGAMLGARAITCGPREFRHDCDHRRVGIGMLYVGNTDGSIFAIR